MTVKDNVSHVTHIILDASTESVFLACLALIYIVPVLVHSLNIAKMNFCVSASLMVLTSVLFNACVIDSLHSIKIGLLFSDLGWPLHYKHFKPACDIAVETVNDLAQQGTYLNLSMSYVWSPTDNFCGNPFMKAPGIASQLHHENNIMAFFGPPCSQETYGIADLAAFWNVPILSGASTSSALDQKNRYRTFTRTSYKLSTLVNYLLSLFERNEWEAAAVIWDPITYWPLVASALRDIFTASGKAVNYVPLGNYQEMNAALVETVERGRSKF